MLHCNTCGIDKPEGEFVKGHKTYCKECLRKYAKMYRAKNKVLIKERQQTWYTEKGKEWKKEYVQTNAVSIAQRDRNRYAEDTSFRMKKILRTRLYKTMKGVKKSKHLMNMLGIDLQTFMVWIEFQFTDDMSWANYASTWEIDHFIPCSSFDLSEKESQYTCFNWKNMRPLYKKDNSLKSNHVPSTNDIHKHNMLVENFLSFNPVPN